MDPSNSLCNAQIRSISSTCNIARNREEKNSRPLKEIISSIGINSNDVRASFFFLVSSSSSRRNVSSTRIVIRRPGRNDSANGTTLAVVSSRRATRRLMKRKRGRGEEKNNYTVCESISMKVAREDSVCNQVPMKIHSFPTYRTSRA